MIITSKWNAFYCWIFLIIVISQIAYAGDNWPSFRGPKNDGISDAGELPVEWSESKNIKWKTAIHDLGFSTPVVWENQIWVTTATEEGHKLYAVCVDFESGKIIHDKLLFEVENPQRKHPLNSYATPSPVIEAGRVYIHFGSDGTACLDTKSGNILWTREDLKCTHWSGPGSSPFMYKHLLILHLEGKDFQYIIARAEKGQNMGGLTEKIKEELRDHRNQGRGNEDFDVQTFEQMIETFNSIFAIISGVVVIIALISVIIAAVNITNTMYTSVLERTKEIGIMKSIGATNKDIAFLFVFESGLLGLVGGAIGVVLGYLIATGGGRAIAQAGFGMLQPNFSLALTIGCLLFAFLVGAISGVLPAKRASKMNPVDALRYE